MPTTTSRRPYPSDLTDAQWELLRPFLDQPQPMGRPRTVDLHEVTNGLLYLLRTGCQWRAIPHDFPHWSVIRYYYDEWTRSGLLVRINDALREQAREALGRHPEPSAGIIDSQSVKTTGAGGARGFDGGKKGHWTQAAHPGGHLRPSPGRHCASGQHR